MVKTIMVEIRNNKVRVAWRTKTTRKQSWSVPLKDSHIEQLRLYEKTSDFEALGDFLNRSSDKEYYFLVIAKLLWAFSKHKTIKIEIIERSD